LAPSLRIQLQIKDIWARCDENITVSTAETRPWIVDPVHAALTQDMRNNVAVSDGNVVVYVRLVLTIRTMSRLHFQGHLLAPMLSVTVGKCAPSTAQRNGREGCEAEGSGHGLMGRWSPAQPGDVRWAAWVIRVGVPGRLGAPHPKAKGAHRSSRKQ